MAGKAYQLVLKTLKLDLWDPIKAGSGWSIYDTLSTR
jgi:hypothetical protein